MVNGHVTEVASLMEGELPCYSLMGGEWLCYIGGHFNGGENGHVTEVVTLMEGEWSCYGGSQFKEGRMVVIEVASNGGGMVMLERWPV